MSITYSWDEDGVRICRVRFCGHWTWDEFLHIAECVRNEGQQLTERFDIINDFLEAPHLPSGSGVTHAYAVFRRLPPNTGLVVVVTQSAFVRALVEILGKVHPETRRTYVAASTLEQARALIEQARADTSAP